MTLPIPSRTSEDGMNEIDELLSDLQKPMTITGRYRDGRKEEWTCEHPFHQRVRDAITSLRDHLDQAEKEVSTHRLSAEKWKETAMQAEERADGAERKLAALSLCEPGFADRMIRERDAAEAAREQAEARVEELEVELEAISADFEKECTAVVRRLLEHCNFEFDPLEGWSADDAESHLRETIDDAETQRVRLQARAEQAEREREAALAANRAFDLLAHRLEAERDAARAQVEALRAIFAPLLEAAKPIEGTRSLKVILSIDNFREAKEALASPPGEGDACAVLGNTSDHIDAPRPTPPGEAPAAPTLSQITKAVCEWDQQPGACRCADLPIDSDARCKSPVGVARVVMRLFGPGSPGEIPAEANRGVDEQALRDCLREAAVCIETFILHSEQLRPYDNTEDASATASRCRFLAAFGRELIPEAPAEAQGAGRNTKCCDKCEAPYIPGGRTCWDDNCECHRPTATPPGGEDIDIVFDGPPGPEAGRFVEVESPPGKSIRFGEWIQRPDGYWCLRISSPATVRDAALEEIIAERRRQVNSEGYDFAHDDKHSKGEIAKAAAAFAAGSVNCAIGAALWPWHIDEFRPKNARDSLIKSAALIVAEIERLDRALRTPAPREGTPAPAVEERPAKSAPQQEQRGSPK